MYRGIIRLTSTLTYKKRSFFSSIQWVLRDSAISFHPASAGFQEIPQVLYYQSFLFLTGKLTQPEEPNFIGNFYVLYKEGNKMESAKQQSDCSISGPKEVYNTLYVSLWDLCKTVIFSWCCVRLRILILETHNVFLRLKFLPSLPDKKMSRFSKVSFQ